MVDFDKLVIGPLQGIFGEPVIYKPMPAYAMSGYWEQGYSEGGPFFQITGVFDKAFHKESLFEDGSVGVTTESPVLGVQLSQFPSIPLQNDRLTVISVNTTFVVREVRLDGHGGAKLMLNKVSSP